jgi:hypothetical protein
MQVFALSISTDRVTPSVKSLAGSRRVKGKLPISDLNNSPRVAFIEILTSNSMTHARNSIFDGSAALAKTQPCSPQVQGESMLVHRRHRCNTRRFPVLFI